MPPQRASRILTRIEPILQHEGFAYTFGLLYVLANVFLLLVGATPEWHHFSGSTAMRIVVSSARGGGALLNLNSALVILVASRVFMTVLRRTPLNMILPFDKAMPNFHAFIGITISFATLLHVVPHLINYGVNDIATSGIHGHISLAVTGTILCLVVLSMRMTTLKRVRKKIAYETFYITHIVGFSLYFGIVILHGSNHGKFSTYKWVVGPLVIYIIDVILRRFRNRGKTVVIPGHTATTSSKGIVRLELARTFSYLPGQYCYLNIPALSRFQWHPFSIASSPHESRLLFFIKADGDWTKALYDMVNTHVPGNSNVDVYVRGPFGAPAQHVGQFEHVILISGGVGATPFTSITKFAHNWIINHTAYGYQTASSAYAAYERNFSIRSAMVPSDLGWRSSSQRAMQNSQALPDIVSKCHDNSALKQDSRFQEDFESGEVEPRTFDTLMLFRPTHEDPRVLDGPKSHAMGKLRSALSSNVQAGGSKRKNFRAKSKEFTRHLPPDYNVSLGDPTAPIPVRGKDRRPSRYVAPRLSGTKDNRRAPSRYDRRFDIDGEYEVEDNEFAAAAALEAKIMFEEEQTPSMRSKQFGKHYAPEGYADHRPSRDESLKYETNGVSEDPKLVEEYLAPTLQDSLLLYVHSVTLNWVLLWIMITRFTLVGIGRVTHGFYLRQSGLSVYKNNALNVFDLILSLVLFLPILATVLTEIVKYGLWTFFQVNIGNGFDLLILTPLALLCVVLHILGLAEVGEHTLHVSKMTVLVIWPVLSIFLLWRIIRTIGARVALAQFMKSEISRTKSLDFLWVARTVEDDAWLVHELLPITFSGAVRIHRFITQSEEVFEDWMGDYPELPLKTTYKRPNWDTVFNNVVENTKSGSVIGVFFCGPHPMARVVQESARNAMQKSIKNALDRRYDEGTRGSRLSPGAFGRNGSITCGAGASEPEFDMRSWAESTNEVSGPAAYGCNVKISVRVENFS